MQKEGSSHSGEDDNDASLTDDMTITDDILKTYQPEYLKTCICVLALFISLMLNQLALCIAHDVVSRDAVPDLVFAIIPEQDWAMVLGDVLCSVAGIVALGFITVFHRYRFIVLRRLLFTITVLYTFRAVCLAVTRIPASYDNNYRKCKEPNHEATPSTVLQRFFKHAFKFGLQISDNGKLICGDLLFSGHTIFVSTTTFYLNHYSPHSIWPLRWCLIITCTGGMICLSISRTHYSVDVLIAYWLSSFLFSIYHSFVLLPHRIRVHTRAYRRLLLFWTMYELEANVPSGRVPNEIEWPLPWPKCLKKWVENWNRLDAHTVAGLVAEQLDAHRLKTHL
ncbi:unnamed protein product [Thelazia callipaeda]|uniref:PAP2_C domain-containing protein n=1 Tax=Thelazia callipaeda TaxID=103827 RepID=A0A0N5D6M9_THECL|nr:unnamed protein product [Thelazia callipaeda]